MIDDRFARSSRRRGVTAVKAVVGLVRFGWVAGWCLVLIVGVPVALARLVGWPLPRELPSSAAVQVWLDHPLTDGFLLKGTACVIWLLWAGFVVAVGVEIIAAIRRVRVPRLRLATPFQGLAAGLVGAIAVTITAAPAATVGAVAHAPVEPQPDAAPNPDMPAAAPVLPAGSGILRTDAAAPALSPATSTQHASAQPVAVVVAPDVHTSTVAPAAHIDAVTLTPVGSVTVLIDGRPYEHTVVKGESLWRIADEYLGDPERWPEIWELNKGEHWPHVSGRTTFSDPDLIFPGWVLTLPADAAAPPVAQPTDSPPETSPPGTTSPPPSATPTPSTSPTTASPTPSATAQDPDGVVPPPAVATPPAVPPPSATATPAPSTSATATNTLSPSATAPPGAPATSTAAPHPVDEGEPSSDLPGWIRIAGGFIGAGLGAGLLYAAAVVWKRRRHHYKPTPITTPFLDDRDLIPPLGALTHIRQTLRRHTPELLDRQPEPGPTVRQYTTADVKPPLPPVGPSGAELAGVGLLPVAAGLGLSGPAALDAARALLVATLTSGHADDPDAQGQAIVPAATLATLLGVSAVDLGPMHRLTVAPSFADALTLVEEEILRRSRIIADHDATDVPTLRAAQALAEPLPQLLLIADVPEEGWHTRLATATRLGTTVEIGTTLIGDWPHGTTLTVAADGSTTGGDGQRVAVLDTATTTEILTMLREAHNDAAPTHDAPAPTMPVGHDAPAPATDNGKQQTPAATTAPTDRQDPPAGVVSVRVLGAPALLDADGTPVRGLRAKSLELLVYLAVHRSGASLDDIMEAIWGDATPRRAAQRLSTCVANLRSVIRANAQPATATDNADGDGEDREHLDPVINTGGHYHLDPTLLHVDWWTVLDEYAQVATATDDTARLAHLQAAVGAIGGGLADGADYEWIDTDREHARRRVVKIFAQAARLLADTDPHQARACLDMACDLDPLSDELARRAMRAAARVGDADAIRTRLAALRRELDDASIELDPDTEQVAATLLRDLANL